MMRLMVYYCLDCGWQSEPDAPIGRVNTCDNCRRSGLRFVGYDEETESASAARILMTAYGRRRVRGLP